MKSVCVFIVLFVALASAYPARDMTDLTDVDFDPFGNNEPVVDTGYFNSYYASLDGFYKRLQDMITSIRERVANGTSDLSASFGDLGKGNTTTYTKIVGNHKIEVNETEYKKDTDFGTSHVKVSYINVRPLNPEIDTTDTVQPEADVEPVDRNAGRDRESLEDTIDNEIVNVDEVGKGKVPERLRQA